MCSDQFLASAGDVAKGYGRFCSHACFSVHRRDKALKVERIAARFWPKVSKSEGCWEWTGALSQGYAVIGIAGRRSTKASHVSWLLTHGRWPNAFMCHRCDNPKCVRPDHLFEGDALANARDACAKGRNARGAETNSTPYSAEDVLKVAEAIRRGMTEVQIVEALGVSRAHVYRVRHRMVWRHVLGPVQ